VIAYSFEPLGDHDRSSFSCGIPELDDYLRLRANQEAKRKVAAPFVMVDQGRRILAITHSLLTGFASPVAARSRQEIARYPLIPATLLGRLAVGREHHGQKLGSLLLMDALHRSWKNSAQIASVGVVAEAINESARKFYLHHESFLFWSIRVS